MALHGSIDSLTTMQTGKLPDYIERLPVESGEREYHRTLYELISRTEFDPTSEAEGFGLLILLSSGELSTEQLDILTCPIGGSIEENSYLVAELFAPVERDPIWWKVHYPSRILDQACQNAAQAWCDKLSALPGVLSVGL